MTATFAHPWEHQARTPRKPAIIFADTGETLTYDELMQRANRSSRLFASLGCIGGDTVAFLSENNATFLELCWAAKNSGLYYACVSNKLNFDDAAYIVENCDAKLLIASQTLADMAARLQATVGTRLQLLTFGGTRRGSASYEALRDRESSEPLGRARRGGSVLYSSGTTGRPKAVRTPLIDVPPTTPPVRHAALLENFHLDGQTVFMNPGPFYHAAPLRMMMSAQREGATIIGFRSFDAEAVLRAIERHRATHGFFVPTMFNRMLQLPESIRRRVDLSSMRVAVHGGAPCPIPIKEAMMKWWGPVVYELYGGTEGCGQTYISPQEWLRKKGSVGKAAGATQIKIFDEHHRPLEPKQIGAIYMSNGRRFEYYKDEQKTADVHDAEGLATIGDIGYLDEDGYLFLTDRRAHMIISGGVNIYPQEAENVLSTHPAVADVAVIGVPHDDLGEEVKAVVQLKEPRAAHPALAADLIAYCRCRLSSYKCPRSVDFAAELPRNEAGKLVKRLIKARYWPAQPHAPSA
jgi:long-chain acyl-CoA synthetase